MGEWLNLTEAALKLQTTPDALRQKVKRNRLQGMRGNDNRMRVWVESEDADSATQPPPEPTKYPDRSPDGRPNRTTPGHPNTVDSKAHPEPHQGAADLSGSIPAVAYREVVLTLQAALERQEQHYREQAAQLQAGNDQLRAGYEQRLTQQHADHERQLTQVRAAHATEVTQLREDADRRVDQLRTDFDRRLDQQRADHQRERQSDRFWTVLVATLALAEILAGGHWLKLW